MRAAVASALISGLDPEAGREVREALGHAARILDIGRSIDFFDRHEHVADIVLATDLDGFSHRDIALLSAIVRSAGDKETNPRSYAPLLGRGDKAPVERAAVLLALADDVVERCPRGTPVSVRCRVTKREATVTVGGLAGWRPRKIGPRFAKAFGRVLTVRASRT
jgi:exopolyphosphatase/guanosine-5'-triphosphate,3'-diphosphate pyrophosphatase